MNDHFPIVEKVEFEENAFGTEALILEGSKMTPDFSIAESELDGEIFKTQEESNELNEDTDVLDFIGVGEIKPEPFEFIGIEQEDQINVPNGLIKKEKCETDLEFDNNKPIGCPSCEVRFVSKWNMKQHFESVHIIEPLECKWCAKTFNGTRNLKRHITSVHDKKKSDTLQTKFACNICEKLFKDKRILIRHIDAVHEKKKPFKVDNNQEFNFWMETNTKV